LKKVNKLKRWQNYLVSTSRQIFSQEIFQQSILFFKLEKFEHLGNGASQIHWLFPIVDLYPSFIQCVALPFGPGHRWQWTKMENHLIQDAGNFNLQVIHSFHSNVVAVGRGMVSWRLGQDSLFCHSSRCKMVVRLADPAQVVPCGGASWPIWLLQSWWLHVGESGERGRQL